MRLGLPALFKFLQTIVEADHPALSWPFGTNCCKEYEIDFAFPCVLVLTFSRGTDKKRALFHERQA